MEAKRGKQIAGRPVSPAGARSSTGERGEPSLPVFDSVSMKGVLEALSEAVAVIDLTGGKVAWSNSMARRAGIFSGETLVLPRSMHSGFKRIAIGIGGRTRYFEASMVPCAPPVEDGTGTPGAQRTGETCFLILSGRQRARERELVSRVTRYCFEDIIGQSPAIENCLRLCRKAAASDLTVLLAGESGTGKELFAQSIHSGSSRREGPFVAINCGAIPRDLIESELFGHERGAFTGAAATRPGRFELASGGTIFLDEIGEMPLSMQIRLLRVLQEREVVRVGGQKSLKVDIRVIAATNRDLVEMVADGRFRQDLFFRLKVLTVAVPPLRERLDDIGALARRFLDRISSRGGPTGFSGDFIKSLKAYDWPGNVRELENLVEVEASLCDGPMITHVPDYLRLRGFAVGQVTPDSGKGVSPESCKGAGGPVFGTTENCPPDFSSPPEGSPPVKLSDLEREAFEKTWKLSHGRQAEVCRSLGISRATFYRKLKEYGLK